MPNLHQPRLLTQALSEIAVQVTSRQIHEPRVWFTFLKHLRQQYTTLADLLNEPDFEWVLADASLTLLFPPNVSFPFGQLADLDLLLNEQFEAVLATGVQSKDEETVHWIEVSYGGSAGEDLPDVARHLGLTERELVKIHTEAIYRVEFVGFLPGFAYLGGLPPELHLPRRAEPRDRVPAGALAMASRYTAVYPVASPGGWHLLGQSELNLFCPDQRPPNRLQAGDTVRFVEV